ncbi:hypothetical protein [Mesorhizobium sp. SP-1A]|uniref:hypothetical protein n=1 Tax=Mesorhizobium sp. SP-1A TaxID=3077840 RepID=UPI0039656CC8
MLFRKAISDISETASLQRLADRIGLSTTSLQALQYGATQVGVAVDQMGDGLGDFAAKVAEAASGAGPLAQIFKANGVELKQQDGTLRSTRDILGEFANLIQNAATPAEQLYLAQQGFGDEAAKMVPLFKDGARGLEQLEANAQAAGAVIDAELVSRAAELDSRFASMWQVFAAESKSALLSAVQGMDVLLGKLAEYQQRRAAADAGAMVGAMVRPKGEAIVTGRGDKPTSMDARFGGSAAVMDPATLAKFQAAYAAPKTVIPTSGGAGAKAGGGGGLKESVDLAEKLIENLQHERDLIGLSGVELEKANALWRAGKDATAEQKAEITALVTAIYSAKEAHEAELHAVEELRDMAKDFASTLVDGLIDGKDATEVLQSAVKQLAKQLAQSGINMLFGGGAGGGFGLFGKLLGFADGGYTGPGGRNQPAGIVHAGEYVMDAKTTRRIGVANLDKLRGYANGGFVTPALMSAPVMPRMAAGGGGQNVHVTVGVSVDQNGNLMPFVESVTQDGIRQAAPHIVTASVQQSTKSVKGQLPGMIADVQARKM